MGIVDIVVIVAAVLIVGLLSYLIYLVTGQKANHSAKLSRIDDPYDKAAQTAVQDIFNKDFREELRNRGRLHFEKVIGENAMFLQQDLRLTTSQLNDYMKQEISRKLQEEFAKYEQSIVDAKQIAVDSINKTQTAIEEQRKAMSDELRIELSKNKAQLLKNFEDHMAEIINHYVLEAIGSQIDLTSQLDFILSDLEASKNDIVEDIRNGA